MSPGESRTLAGIRGRRVPRMLPKRCRSDRNQILAALTPNRSGCPLLSAVWNTVSTSLTRPRVWPPRFRLSFGWAGRGSAPRQCPGASRSSRFGAQPTVTRFVAAGRKVTEKLPCDCQSEGNFVRWLQHTRTQPCSCALALPFRSGAALPFPCAFGCSLEAASSGQTRRDGCVVGDRPKEAEAR